MKGSEKMFFLIISILVSLIFAIMSALKEEWTAEIIALLAGLYFASQLTKHK